MPIQLRLNQYWSNLIKGKWQLALFCALHILIFEVFFETGWIYGSFLKEDFGLLYFYSSRIMLGQMPYGDFALEYPPVALVFMLIPRLLSSNPELYSQLFKIEVLVFDLIGLCLVAAIAGRLDKPVWKTLAIYSLALLAIGPIIVVRYDLIPAIILLIALYTFLRGHYTTSWVLLGVGLLTKLFPAVAAPLFLIYHFRRHQYRDMVKGVSAFILTCIIISVPFLILSPGGFLNSFTYHTGRSLQCETSYASFLLLGKYFGLVSLEMENSSGSTNVTSPLADTLANLSPLIMLVCLLAVFWAYYRNLARPGAQSHSGHQAGKTDIGLLTSYLLIALIAFLVTNKVLSPQFLIWLLPFVPLIISRWRNLPWLIFILAGFMTYFVYPKDYGGLEYGEFLAIGMLVLRNVALIALAVLVATGNKNLDYREEIVSG